jgi:uridylate kinase
MPQKRKKAKRIMLKLSGETLLGTQKHGINIPVLGGLAKQIAEVHKKGYQVSIVVGAGNIWRYRDTKGSGIERVASDHIGMLATIMNGVALMSAIEKLGVQARVSSAITVPEVAEPFIIRRAIRHLEKGRVVICAGGTGNPFFTTDTAAALRALEFKCDVLLKATNVKGVYSDDPKKNPKAKFYKKVSYDKVLEKNLKVMDASAVALCRDGSMPVTVFQFDHKKNNILKILEGKIPGTHVY